MKLNFRQDVLVLPASVLSCCEDADAASLRVLLWLAGDLSLAAKPRQLAKLSDCSEREVARAIDLWVSKQILTEEQDGEAVAAMATVKDVAQKAEKKERRILQRADTLPVYTSSELAELIEKRQGMRELVDEAQQILGKMFNPSEINILVAMVDYLSIDEDCILLLLAHCKRIGKSNLRSIEKYAYSLVDDGITEAFALEERFRQLELLHTFEGEVRTLFGMKSRALTSKEKKMLQKWCEFGYGIDVVQRAYDITVSATNTPSPAYANAILERWNSEGLKTAAEIDAKLAEEAIAKGDGTSLGNSFDTDDFFEAALQRSFAQGETD